MITKLGWRKRGRPKTGKAVSLTDVAALAKVSTATVSRVLNSSATVSTEVRRRVERACHELAYVPNGAARALAARRTMTIGAVVPAIENVGIARSVAAFQQRLKQASYTLLLASSTYDSAVEMQEVRTLLSRGVDGLMLVGGDHDPGLMDLIKHHNVPHIETWTLTQGRLSVGLDNVKAAKLVTHHLINLGHSRIGLIMGRVIGNDRAALRVQGIRASLMEAGLEPSIEWLIDRPYNIADGRMATQALLASPNRPTALICGNDQIAFGAMIQAVAEGLKVPDDLSVTGFNDLEFAEHLSPPLTTVRVPTEDIGRISAEYLLRAIDDSSFKPTSFEVPATLVVRESTAAWPSVMRRRTAEGSRRS